ncbi:unnamed protein product [Caenorhabditis auriculariae]|uniref:Gluconokinase n=1 Tax=Caenorhabditis auriculariae TaxID=2777116 RepID=A0A8S1GW74_9PELO|nr:unnamed protein product [Caenorhabditis auriculariae]
MEEEQKDVEKKPFSFFTGLQYATTGAATLLFLRSGNRFLTHAQRGKTITAAVCCLYLSVANEMGWLPFNYFVKERISIKEQPTKSFCTQLASPSESKTIAEQVLRKDCFECRVIGTGSCTFIGTFILYNTWTSDYYIKRPYVRAALKSFAAVAFYGAAARWFYLPPFTNLKEMMIKPEIIYVMGVSGAGKSTVAEHLAEKISWTFIDGDNFHSRANIEKMKNGIPLQDEDRWPWLENIRVHALENSKLVIACSSLKKKYRELLAKDLQAVFVFLDVTRTELEMRMTKRTGHFMPCSMLDSQLATLEYPRADEKNVVVVKIADLSIDGIVTQICRSLDC